MDLARLRPRLPGIDSPNERPREAVVIGMSASIAIIVVGLIAVVMHEPFIFPSLGSSAFLIMADPKSPVGSTRNTICAHGIALLSGVVGLALFGLLGVPPDLQDVTPARAAAAAVAVLLTVTLMLLLRVPHPPAVATCLIVSLGLLRGPADYLVMTGAVIAVIVVTRLLNLLRGLRPPLWAPRPEAEG